MKKVFIVVTLLLGITLVAMLLTKPEPQAHYDAVVGLAQSVVDQEMNSGDVKGLVPDIISRKKIDRYIYEV